jgi:co-chaperonin GroES (HSP10)
MSKRAFPLGTNVLVNPIDDERKTEQGIYLIGEVGKSPFRKGAVEEKGGGDKWNNMSEIHKGDIILYSKGAGVPVKKENEKGEEHTFLLIPYDKIIAVE